MSTLLDQFKANVQRLLEGNDDGQSASVLRSPALKAGRSVTAQIAETGEVVNPGVSNSRRALRHGK